LSKLKQGLPVVLFGLMQGGLPPFKQARFGEVLMQVGQDLKAHAELLVQEVTEGISNLPDDEQ
jgi:hypothetical protein